MRHRSTTQIEAGMDHVLAAPRDHGRVEMLVVRPGQDRRATPAAVTCTVAGGIVGDDWAHRGSRHTPDGRPNPDQQVTMMNARYLDLVAGERDRWPLAGDQLVVDLDLGEQALAAGDRLRVGEVVVEVTAHPHRGCDKFRDRYGLDAVRFANSPVGRRHRLRGAHLRVVVPGEVRVGDTIEHLAADPTATAADADGGTRP